MVEITHYDKDGKKKRDGVRSLICCSTVSGIIKDHKPKTRPRGRPCGPFKSGAGSGLCFVVQRPVGLLSIINQRPGPVVTDPVVILFEKYAIEDEEGLAGAYILVLGTPSVSQRNKVYCDLSVHEHMTMRVAR